MPCWTKIKNSKKTISWHKTKKFRTAEVTINKHNNKYNINALCVENASGGTQIERFDKNVDIDSKSLALRQAKVFMNRIDKMCFR